MHQGTSMDGCTAVLVCMQGAHKLASHRASRSAGSHSVVCGLALCCCLQEEDNLREALRYSAAMLGELRTSFLSPQRYYELYMQVFDELGNLEVSRQYSSSVPYSSTAVSLLCAVALAL
eukprot:GHRQ01021995.1.p2 GENE.GHRQ01021995.1~~GHRQ01021995.1.p2  ORF type:complete len:119 (-),score=25.01 GHRQ01021995.1:92-448(-)